MNCLIDYISLEGCAAEVPVSGYYLNRLLPGLPLESFDRIATADQQTFLGVWTDIQQRNALRFDSEVVRAFQKKYQVKRITESFDLLQFIDTVNNQTAAAAKWRGFTIELVQSNQFRWVQSALQVINLQSIRIYRKAVTASFSAKVFNLETGEVLSTITVPANAAAGWTQVNVGERYYVPRIFVAFDSTLVNCVELDIDQDIINRFHDCMCNEFSDCEAVINGAQSASLSTTVTDSDITTGDNLFGFSGVFSVGCSYYSIVCQNKIDFLMPWAFLLGRELMWERINTTRLNRFTLGVDLEKAKKLYTEFDVLFAQELETVIAGISLNTADCCLECNAPVQYRESML